MITRHFKKLLIPTIALAAILACGPLSSAATPQPAATLDALYTSAAQTLSSMSTQGAYYTFTPQVFPTATLSIATATPIAPVTFTSVPALPPPVTRCDAAKALEKLSVVMALKSLDRCQVAVLLLDASEGVSAQEPTSPAMSTRRDAAW